MSNRYELRKRELDGTSLQAGRHSGNQEVIARERLGLNRLYGNPNSKIEKKKRREERKIQGSFEAKEP